MLNQIKAEAEAQGVNLIESDGQNSAPKQTADIEAAIVQKVNAIVISPLDVNALAPAIEQAVQAGVPVVTIDRRVDGVEGILAHVGADNVKGGEAEAQAMVAAFPNGAKIFHLQGQPGAGPAIDRNKGVHNVLDPHEGQVPDHLRADRQLRPRRGAVGHRGRPCRQRQARRDHLRQ